MILGKTVSLVIPCHNEEEGLRKILPLIPKEIDEVIIVDNNSKDATAEVARQNGAVVVTEKKPGYGSAYKAGFKAVKNEIIATMDGDGQYPTEELLRLITKVIEKNIDFLSACRFPLKGVVMNRTRQIGNFLLTSSSRLLFNYKIKDTQSGMWIFKKSILEKVKPQDDGMPFSEEIKIKTIMAGYTFDEEWIDYKERIGPSKLLPLQDGWNNLIFLLKLRFSGSKI